MKKLYKRIRKMREEQEAEAGPLFAELSTPETWIELLRWMLRREEKDFTGQMTEVAAMAVWALQASEKSAHLAALLEAALAENAIETDVESSLAQQFGPLDRPIPFPPRRSSQP